MTITAEVVLDSIGSNPTPRLTTFLVKYPKFVHAEHCRHRTMSLCVSSSRAIPVSKNLEEVRSDVLRAAPVYWGSEQRGMQSGQEVTGANLRQASQVWRRAALSAVETATNLIELGIHKSLVNRLLEPFLHVNVLVTSCEPGLLNFFGLRLDKAAQPEIRVLAEAMWAAWNESKPQKLEPGQWHLPLIDSQDVDDAWLIHHLTLEEFVNWARKVSTARCARLSYMSFETKRRSTIEEDLKLYERLVGSHPIHASPAEHQGTPDQWVPGWYDNYGNGWKCPELHGNLPGWLQHRKLLPNESVAPLPEGYEYVNYEE